MDGWTEGLFLTHLKTATVTEDLDVILIGNACARGIRSEVNVEVAML
jgi:hypothetical protein